MSCLGVNRLCCHAHVSIVRLTTECTLQGHYYNLSIVRLFPLSCVTFLLNSQILFYHDATRQDQECNVACSCSQLQNPNLESVRWARVYQFYITIVAFDATDSLRLLETAVLVFIRCCAYVGSEHANGTGRVEPDGPAIDSHPDRGPHDVELFPHSCTLVRRDSTRTAGRGCGSITRAATPHLRPPTRSIPAGGCGRAIASCLVRVFRPAS